DHESDDERDALLPHGPMWPRGESRLLRRRRGLLLTDGGADSPGPSAALVTERLWRDVHERLTAFVAQRVRESADVADIVQTVFLRVHRHLGSVEDES